MRKKIISKRKTRQKLNKIFSIIILFFVTLGALFTFYVFFVFSTHKKSQLVNPVSFTKTAPNQPLTIVNSTGELKSLLESQNISVKEVISASDSSTLVILDDGGEVLFTQKKKLQEQIASLQLIITRLTIEGRQFKRIDLRFDNPVIVF